ncbi:MAG: class I SAM-dependent methyltransferase [Clostridia bacterium]|nr:class I SAM-dependent methyltransferase [Clostridia bacterium]
MKVDVIRHYDLLIEENNDPVFDTPNLKAYMDKYDGEKLKEALFPLGGKSVLEIGVGTGRLAQIYAPLCGNFTGVDVSPKTAARAKENLKDLSVDIICADFLEYDFEKTFDIVYSSLTFMHIKNKRKAISKISSVLNNGGKFVLSITKSQDKILDYGTRKLELFPDKKEKFFEYLKDAKMSLNSVFETELAYILVATKENK